MSATIRLPFNSSINTSLQVGDIVYYCTPESSGKGTITKNEFSDIIKLGDCKSITSTYIEVENVPSAIDPVPVGSFLLFSKNNKVNIGSLKGYYALVEFRNNSTQDAEMFSVGVDVNESSK